MWNSSSKFEFLYVLLRSFCFPIFLKTSFGVSEVREVVGYQQGNPLRGPVGVFFRFGEHTTGVMGKTHIFFENFTPKAWGKRFPIWRADFSLVGWFNHQLELIHCTPDHWLRFPNRSKRWWCCTTTARRGHVAYVRIDTLLKNDLTLNMYNMSSKGEGTLSKSLGFHICVVVDCWGTDRLPAPKVNQHLTEVRTCLWSFGVFFCKSWVLRAKILKKLLYGRYTCRLLKLHSPKTNSQRPWK